MRFLFIGSRFTLHASSPHSVTLVQLRFTSFIVINLRRDLHPQECAHAGRTKQNGPLMRAVGSEALPRQSACLRRKAGISISSMPLADRASTLAAAVRPWRQTLGTRLAV